MAEVGDTVVVRPCTGFAIESVEARICEYPYDHDSQA